MSTEPDKGHCASCGALILWAKTTTGSLMPIDREPRADGNITLAYNLGPLPIAHVARKEQVAKMPRGTPLYLSHFATCPNAKKHRKAKAKETE